MYAGAHNGVLAEFAQATRRRLQPYRQAQFRLPGRPIRSHEEHEAVVAAILAGNAAEAHAAMLHHVHRVEISLDDLASTLDTAGT